MYVMLHVHERERTKEYRKSQDVKPQEPTTLNIFFKINSMF